jgi:hypothetical protein
MRADPGLEPWPGPVHPGEDFGEFWGGQNTAPGQGQNISVLPEDEKTQVPG